MHVFDFTSTSFILVILWYVSLYLLTISSILLIGTSVTWPKAEYSKILISEKKQSQLSPHFPEKLFQAPKLYSDPPSWLARGRCHMSTFWKTKDWSSHFWESQPFRFWNVDFHCQRRLNSTKTGISSWF